MNLKGFLTTTLAMMIFTAAASAQSAADPATTATSAATSTATTTAPATSEREVVPSGQLYDSRGTRQEFMQLLRRHPDEVAVVLKLDPSLFRNEQWLATYPELRAFAQRHPEVAQNPSYFLEEVSAGHEASPMPPSVRMAQQMLEGLMIFISFALVGGVLIWLVRTLLEHRKWSRITRIQSEIQNKLLDRFTSQEDLLRYVQTSGGKEFLEAATAPLTRSTPPLAAPIGRIFWSVQAGIVLIALGIGMMVVSATIPAEVAPTVLTLGVLTFSCGIGFTVAAAVAWAIARKLGLWPPTSETLLPVERTLHES